MKKNQTNKIKLKKVVYQRNHKYYGVKKINNKIHNYKIKINFQSTRIFYRNRKITIWNNKLKNNIKTLLVIYKNHQTLTKNF